MISDSAIYVDGKRTASPGLEGTRHTCGERGGFAWVGLVEPDEEELASVTSEFGLPELAVRDAVKAHHRPRADRYGETLLDVLRTARLNVGTLEPANSNTNQAAIIPNSG